MVPTNRKVPTDRLIKFVQGTFDWKALPPAEQRAMALEILTYRHMAAHIGAYLKLDSQDGS